MLIRRVIKSQSHRRMACHRSVTAPLKKEPFFTSLVKGRGTARGGGGIESSGISANLPLSRLRRQLFLRKREPFCRFATFPLLGEFPNIGEH